LIATILIYIIIYLKKIKIKKEDLKNGIFLGIVLFFGYMLQTVSLKTVDGSIVAFLTAFSIIIVPIIGYFVFKQEISFKTIFLAIVAVIGVYLITMNGDLLFGFGEFLSLFCAFFFALHLVLTEKFCKKNNIFVLVFFQLLIITIFSLFLSLTMEETTFSVEFNQDFLSAIIITSLFATVYAFLIQTYSQKYVTATKTAIIFSFEPLVAAIIGVTIGGEYFTIDQVFGGFLIIVSTIMIQVRFKKDIK
jgi:drug/metabolite transporter (DMT)-like permease